MSRTRSECIGTFHSTYAVLKMEKILKGLGIEIKMVPVPRQISSNCGISIRFGCDDLERVRAAATPLSDDLEGFFRLRAEGNYERL